MSWLDAELASKSSRNESPIMKRFEGNRIGDYSQETDQIRLIEDTDGDGKADKDTVFADGFNASRKGLALGCSHGRAASISRTSLISGCCGTPMGDGKADVRKSLSFGYGIRVGFLGHDLQRSADGTGWETLF